MTHIWSDWLVKLPVVGDLGLRLSVVLLLAWAFHGLLVRSNPRWRVQLWRFTSVAVIFVATASFLPGITFLVDRQPEVTVLSGSSEPYVDPYGKGPYSRSSGMIDSEMVIPPVYERHEHPLHSFLPQDEVREATALLPTAVPTPGLASRVFQQSKTILLGIWLAGTLFFIVRWTRAQLRIQRMLAYSQPAPKRTARLLRRVADRLDLFGDFQLRLSNETDVPFVAGLWQPTVVLPAHMTEPKFSEELPAIFAHELTHIKSSDLTWLCLSQWIAMPLWFHPLAWKITTAQAIACEEVADAVAADSVGDVDCYSGTLARLALMAVSHPPAVALSMARSSMIVSRLARLKQGLSNRPLARRRLILSMLLGLLTLVPLATIKLAYAEEQKTAAAAIPFEGPGRVLHFPEDYSVGRLSIATQKESEWWDQYFKRFDYRRDWDWKYFGLAQGDVTVPVDAQVSLLIKPAGAVDTSWIKQLQPDDLTLLTVFPHPGEEEPFPFGDIQMENLSHLTGLKELTLQYVQVSGRGLQALKPLTQLEKLVFRSSNGDNDSLNGIGQLSSLQVLQLEEGSWNDAGLEHLSRLDQLEELTLANSGDPGSGFSAIAKLPKLKLLCSMHLTNAHLEKLQQSTSLRALNLLFCKSINDDGMKSIAQLSELEYLNLHHNSVTDAGIQHLRPLKKLKQLKFMVNSIPKGPVITVASADVISGMTSLEQIDTPAVGNVDEFLARLSPLKNLKSLMIAGRPDTGLITDAGVRQLTNFPKLERLTISGTELTDAAADDLAKLSHLKWLSLSSDTMTDDGLVKLAALRDLRYVNISGNPRTGKLTYSGIMRLNGLPDVTEVWYYARPAGPDDRPLDFSGMPRLEKLGMPGVRDQDIAGLKECKHLKWLMGCKLSDTGIAQLETLPQLEQLSFSGQKVTDDSLAHLAGMNQINFLSIDAPITEKSLPHLEKLKSLEFLTVSTPARFSVASVDHLKSNMPNLRSFSFNGNRAKEKLPHKQLLRYGQEAPPFELNLLDGETVTLKDYRGKVLLLYFWSTGCGPCIAAIPNLKKSYAEASKHEDFEMIGISGDDIEARWKSFVRKNELPWPQARIGNQSKMALSYGVAGYPRYILIDREGKILTSVTAEVDSALKKALNIKDEP